MKNLDNFDNVVIIEKQLMIDIIGTLKTIHPTDYDGMDKLVGCVTMLTMSLNPPPKEEETVKETIDPSELEVVEDG